MMVFVHSSEPAGLPGDLGQPYRAVPGMGLPFGASQPCGHGLSLLLRGSAMWSWGTLHAGCLW